MDEIWPDSIALTQRAQPTVPTNVPNRLFLAPFSSRQQMGTIEYLAARVRCSHASPHDLMTFEPQDRPCPRSCRSSRPQSPHQPTSGFTDDDPAGTRIPGALDRVISAGVTIEPRKLVFGSLRVRHFGPRPLIEDRSVNSKNTTIWNGEVGYRLSTNARLVLEAFNLFDADVSDIDYVYSSRLPGEPADGVVDIHTHPALPRSARVGIQFSF